MGKIRGWVSINHVGDEACTIDSPSILPRQDAVEQTLEASEIEEDSDPVYELDDSSYAEDDSTGDYLNGLLDNVEKGDHRGIPAHSCPKPESEQKDNRSFEAIEDDCNESARVSVRLIQDKEPEDRTKDHQEDEDKTERICRAIAQLEPTYFEDDSDCYCDIIETSMNIIQTMINLVSTEELDSFRILEELQEIAIKQGKLASKHNPLAKSPNLNALIELVRIKSASGEAD